MPGLIRRVISTTGRSLGHGTRVGFRAGFDHAKGQLLDEMNLPNPLKATRVGAAAGTRAGSSIALKPLRDGRQDFFSFKDNPGLLNLQGFFDVIQAAGGAEPDFGTVKLPEGLSLDDAKFAKALGLLKKLKVETHTLPRPAESDRRSLETAFLEGEKPGSNLKVLTLGGLGNCVDFFEGVKREDGQNRRYDLEPNTEFLKDQGRPDFDRHAMVDLANALAQEAKEVAIPFPKGYSDDQRYSYSTEEMRGYAKIYAETLIAKSRKLGVNDKPIDIFGSSSYAGVFGTMLAIELLKAGVSVNLVTYSAPSTPMDYFDEIFSSGLNAAESENLALKAGKVLLGAKKAARVVFNGIDSLLFDNTFFDMITMMDELRDAELGSGAKLKLKVVSSKHDIHVSRYQTDKYLNRAIEIGIDVEDIELTEPDSLHYLWNISELRSKRVLPLAA